MVTKAGEMHYMGCFVMDDFDLSTRGGEHKLTADELKHLLYVKQPAHIAAIYSTAVFPPEVPRLWSINYDYEEEPASWFVGQNHNGSCAGLIHLAQGDECYFPDRLEQCHCERAAQSSST